MKMTMGLKAKVVSDLFPYCVCAVWGKLTLFSYVLISFLLNHVCQFRLVKQSDGYISTQYACIHLGGRLGGMIEIFC